MRWRSEEEEAEDEDAAEEDKGGNWGTARSGERDGWRRIDAGEERTTAIALQEEQTSTAHYFKYFIPSKNID